MSLEITMFGGFLMRYKGQQLKLERNNNTRSMQVLQLLIYHGANGIPKDALMDMVFGDDEDVSNPANNLKVTISNLRRILQRAGLPETTTVVFKAGNYYFESEEPMQVDAFLFEEQVAVARAATGEQRAEEFANACSLYSGDFLPHLTAYDWAMVAAIHYKEQYRLCVQALSEILQEQNNYKQLLRLATRASSLCPQEEWDILRIRSLLALQRYQEAKEVYEEATTRLIGEFGIKPSEHLLECLKEIEQLLPNRKASLEELQRVLMEENEESGAYYCTFPSFIDTYRTVSRMLDRSGQTAYLMMCWATDKKGQRLDDKVILDKTMPSVGEAIHSALRRGDIYTRAENDRYLILLMGINRENCGVVINRIENYYKEMRRGTRGPAITLHYKVGPVYGMNETSWSSGALSWD